MKDLQMTAVEWLVEQIENQQKFYIDLAKKDKTKRKEVDAILTATTLFKMKCGKAKEMEKQQSDDYAIEFAEWCRGNYDFIKKEDYTILLKKFKKENNENKN
jgi:hypothetical protein